IGFTGSVAVGKKLAALCATEMKSYVMELGGNAPVIVMDDVKVDHVAAVVAARKIRNAGQVCTAPNRLFVHSRVFRDFVKQYAQIMERVKVGPAADPSSEMGPLANSRRVVEMSRLVENATSLGAKIVCGGKGGANRGYFWQPTVITDV